MNWREAAYALAAVLFLALFCWMVLDEEASQPERVREIESCIASGGTPIVGHDRFGRNIISVRCAQGGRP